MARAPPLARATSTGGAHLTEDLALAEHHRVEAGGHLEEVPGRRLVVLGEQERVEVVGVQRADVAQEVAMTSA